MTAPTPLTGEVTMVPSTANPVPGENVTFTVEATGTAPAGSALSIVGFYRVLHFGSVSPSIPALLNATATTANGTVVVTEDPAFRSFRFDFTVTASGAYSVRFTVDTPVLSSVPVGTSVTPSVRIDGSTGTLNGATAFLTVAANPTPPTVTMTASKPYPRPNESLTYTVTVSGEAYAGTTFTLTDLLPGTVTLVGVETVASTNVDAITLTPGEPVTGTFAVPSAGSFSVTFAIETTVNRGLSPGTEISNTACVDVSAGPQDTCATAQVATLNFSALIQLLIALLLSLLGPLTP